MTGDESIDVCAECKEVCEGNSKYIEEFDATYCYFEEPDGYSGCYADAYYELKSQGVVEGWDNE